MNLPQASENSNNSIEHIQSEFERLKRIASHGAEFWSARDLQVSLGYDKWQNFQVAIERAKTSCLTFGKSVGQHFTEVSNVLQVATGPRSQQDFLLSRYGCYLIAQNGDSSKSQIAAAQAYFAFQTHRQEIQDEMTAQAKRITARERLAASHKRLSGAAHEAGVVRFGVFHDEGYKGLYGGMGIRAVKTYKGLPQSEDLVDRMGHVELAANDFRATQAEERLRNDEAHNEAQACRIHSEVGKSVRNLIIGQGNTPPENLRLEEDIRPLLEKKKREEKKYLKDQEKIS